MAVPRGKIDTARWCWPRPRPRSRAFGMPNTVATMQLASATARPGCPPSADRPEGIRPNTAAGCRRRWSRRWPRRWPRGADPPFLNRRGYAPLVLCRVLRRTAEGARQLVLAGRAPLFRGGLVCHLTGFSMKKPDPCPYCGRPRSAWSRSARAWSGSRRRARGPVPRRAHRDLLDDAMEGERARGPIGGDGGQRDRHPGGDAGRRQGPQLPGLTLVGVVDATSPCSGDLRAAQRTYQLLAQVAGRAGRQAAPAGGGADLGARPPGDAGAEGRRSRQTFLAREIEGAEGRGAAALRAPRRIAGDGRASREAAEDYARERRRARRRKRAKIEVLGPAEAPLAVIRGRHRFRLLVKATREADLQAYLRLWLAKSPRPKGDIRLAVDVDPYNFL